ncbi:hypothetical protein COCC4DRAFT_200424 [Bipolaris maydis ATCC 48331]|uniref:Uncharacterized protein n=2 Tax=Cochliobolus heterostrophus TaxID=5016 RepID=M2SMK8_COCH5|nr:uncharacterized protein COCC4DRAFT_200424 [Bipolaris maydis ATCC 48331]EMD86570.1 hypothetical protein COCHEDRAFT_1197997 [Bipolaris maydis C5]ENI02985.1 hypothetical protein COCC4DRAFT_200424 [Bipolaris maydis ATCC 48331]KAJ6267504.1 hypothetical protein PSV08DRAFT_326204 [Bipolaris maydis]KAJ6267553.1 hypothetical protein PSV08DRAFT_326312 [Bipolaris maydis]
MKLIATEPNLEYLGRPGKLDRIPCVWGNLLRAVTHSKNDMEKIFENEGARKFAYRVHDAGNHLFLVLDHQSSPVLLRRVAFDNSVNLELEGKEPDPESDTASYKYSNLLQESLRQKELYGWIIYEELISRCPGFVKPYALVPCLARDQLEWV